MQQVHLYLQSSTFGFLLSNKLSFKYQPLKLNPFCREENLSKMLFSRYCIDECNNVRTVIRCCKSVSILKKSITCEKKKKNCYYCESIIYLVLNSFSTLDFNLVISMNINLDMVWEIQ